MIGATGKYRSMESVEDLLSLSIKDLRRGVEKQGYRLSQIISGYQSGRVREYSGTMSWTRTTGGRYNRHTEKAGEIGYSIGKDSEGVYIQLNYNCKLPGESEFHPVQTRYYLVARESNLKPGTCRYYFLDPYSEEDSGLCSKLYLYSGVFYPRSILRSYGVLYKQQREGHTQRYVWTFSHRVPDTWRKYGKTHYRGKITPGYERYCYLVEESDRREFAELIWKYPEFLADYPFPDGGDIALGAEYLNKEDFLRTT